MPQAYLGIAFGFGIPMAFAAQTGEVPFMAWFLMGANMLWVIAYDTEYAMVDRVDDLKIGIKTSAITFGRFDVAGVMACHAAFLGAMVVVGLVQKLGVVYYLGSGRRAGTDTVSIPPDPRPRPGALLQGIPAQQLGGRNDIRRHCA